MILSMADALDFQIINALQIHPRVTWAQLGSILRVDPSTISRRWNALVASRDVWTTCFEGDIGRAEESVTALVEIVCVPGSRSDVISELARKGRIFSIHCTSGPRDLYIMISTPSLMAMDRYVDENVSAVHGIVGTRTHYLRTVYFEGSLWRLQTLSRSQTDALARLRPSPAKIEHRDVYSRLVTALASDVRRTTADIHQELGRSVAAVSRDMEAILAADWVRWRVDFAHNLMGWTAAAVLWLNVKQSDLERVASSLKYLPQVRFCASVTGEANLAVSMWLHNLQELDALESKVTRTFDTVEVKDRWIVPRIVKRAGHLLDLDSRRQDLDPLDRHAIVED